MAYGSHLYKQSFLSEERKEELEKLRSTNENLIELIKEMQIGNKRASDELQYWMDRLASVCKEINKVIG